MTEPACRFPGRDDDADSSPQTIVPALNDSQAALAAAHLPRVPPLPDNAPRCHPRLSRLLGQAWLQLSGWRLTGSFPDVPKLVLIAAPHSSNWDGLHGLAMRQVLGLEVSLVAKRQLFWWPLGPLLSQLGAVPIDRPATSAGSAAEAGGLSTAPSVASTALVQQMSAEFARRERFWLGLAPEGTRRPVTRWKTGFWRIARAADVPILPVYFHYPEKRIGIGPLFQTSPDMAADLAALRAFYAPWRGRKGKRAV